jgi:hypothetical protein
MRKIVKRKSENDQVLFQSVHFLASLNRRCFHWPNSPLLVLFSSSVPTCCSEAGRRVYPAPPLADHRSTATHSQVIPGKTTHWIQCRRSTFQWVCFMSPLHKVLLVQRDQPRLYWALWNRCRSKCQDHNGLTPLMYTGLAPGAAKYLLSWPPRTLMATK